MRSQRPTAITLAALLILPLAMAGCAAKPHAAATNLRLTDQEHQQKLLLNDRDRTEIRAAFASLVAQHEPVLLPSTAEHGVRWADVQLAAFYACMDVEMAIMRTHRSKDHLRFELRSANERIGELIVQRVDDDRVYTANAAVGMFGDDHDTAQRLLTAFDRRMRAFGTKRSFDK